MMKMSTKEEITIIEKVYLLTVFDNKHKIFKKIHACDNDFIISKN